METLNALFDTTLLSDSDSLENNSLLPEVCTRGSESSCTGEFVRGLQNHSDPGSQTASKWSCNLCCVSFACYVIKCISCTMQCNLYNITKTLHSIP